MKSVRSNVRMCQSMAESSCGCDRFPPPLLLDDSAKAGNEDGREPYLAAPGAAESLYLSVLIPERVI